jgi:hypothetical protein
MDLIRFDALVGSIDRVTSLEKINTAWLNMASAQCTTKGMKDVLKPIEKRISKTFSSGGKKTGADFIARLKKGF